MTVQCAIHDHRDGGFGQQCFGTAGLVPAAVNVEVKHFLVADRLPTDRGCIGFSVGFEVFDLYFGGVAVRADSYHSAGERGGDLPAVAVGEHAGVQYIQGSGGTVRFSDDFNVD